VVHRDGPVRGAVRRALGLGEQRGVRAAAGGRQCRAAGADGQRRPDGPRVEGAAGQPVRPGRRPPRPAAHAVVRGRAGRAVRARGGPPGR